MVMNYIIDNTELDFLELSGDNASEDLLDMPAG
jgi:hypothetical protein